MFARRLTTWEIALIRRGPAEFALYLEGDVIFFLYRFDTVFDWSDAPYTWHLVHPARRIFPTPAETGVRAMLHIFLVEAASGITVGLRGSTLSPDFTEELHSAIRAQAAHPWDSAAYNEQVLSIYARYKPHELVKRAIVRCRAGA